MGARGIVNQILALAGLREATAFPPAPCPAIITFYVSDAAPRSERRGRL